MVKNIFKKGQSLPLNTIVIAILVIIVLLVIIVFFTSKVGESGETLNKQSASECKIENPVIAAVATEVNLEQENKANCEALTPGDWSVFPGLEGNSGKVCCVKNK